MPNMYSVKYFTRTEAEDRTKICTVMWTIPNFSELLEVVAKQTLSDLRTNKADCVDNTDEDTKFLLKMEFLGKETDLIEIYYLAPVPMFLKSILTICLKCYKERSIVMKEYNLVQPNKWQFLGPLFKRDILSLDSCESFLNEGSLVLKFQFMINKEINLDPGYGPKAQLNCDLENLLNNSSFSDVTIKSAEGVEFQTHKAVLATRSTVLKAHFEHNTVESLTNIIETPLETEVLKEVLRYIYTDNTPKVEEIPEKLLAAAEYYQMSRLKNLCEEALYQKLTVDNAIATLELADLYSATNLRKMTLDFINDGHARLIIKTKSWAELPAAITKTILEFILSSGQMEADLR